MITNLSTSIIRTLKRSITAASTIAVVVVAVCIYGQPAITQASSIPCSKQTVVYGEPRSGGYGINLSGARPAVNTKSMPARNSSNLGLSNPTDVDITRTLTMTAGTYEQGTVVDGSPSPGTTPGVSVTDGTSVYMQMNHATGAPAAPSGYQEVVHDFTSSPVRNLSFSVLDIEQSTNFKEVAEVMVYENGSLLSDVSPYATIENNSVDYAGSNIYKGNPTTVGPTNANITQGNVSFNFGEKLITKIAIRYTFESNNNTPFEGGAGMIVRDISFDGPCIGLAVNAIPEGDTVKLDYTVENTGGLPLTAISIPENLDAIFGAGNYTIVSTPSRISGESSIIANDAFAGGAAGDILKPASALALDKNAVVRLVVKVKNPAVGGDGKGNYSSTENVIARPLAATAYNVTDDSVSGAKVDVNGNGDAADDTSPWRVSLSSVAVVPGTPGAGDVNSVSKPVLIAGLSTAALTPLAYLNRARLFARFRR